MSKDTLLDVPASILIGGEKTSKTVFAYKAVMTTLFTPKGWDVYMYMARHQGQVPPATDFEDINHNFLEVLGNLHELPASTDQTMIKAHWGRSLNSAYSLVNHAYDLAIPRGVGYRRGQDAEIYNRSPEPHRILRSLAYHLRARFRLETRRQFALALVIGSFDAFVATASLRNRNEEIGEIFSEELFTSRGGQHDFTTYGYFDTATNEYVGRGDTKTPPDEYTDVKEIERVARHIEGAGSVHYDPRIKEPERAGLKAITKSIKNGKNLQITGHVPDTFGAKITYLGETGESEIEAQRKVAEIMDKSIKVLEERYPGITVERKDAVGNGEGNDRGQSKLMDRLVPMKRALFTFPDLPKDATFELIVRTLRSEMNGDYMNGIVNPVTRRRVGPGHKHYELDNLAGPAFYLLFPPDLQRIDREGVLAVQSASIAEQLRYNSEDPLVHIGKSRDNGYFSNGYFLATEGIDGPGSLYQIIEINPKQFRLKRPDGTEFFVSQTRVREHGLIGSERLLGSIRKLL